MKAFLQAGISVATVNYRLLQDACAAKVVPPLQCPLNDAARALQFVRAHAGEWNVDKTRIGACGVSAGGCSALWLALHDNMARPQSDDPLSRESTRVVCVAAKAPQTSLDPRQTRRWIPNYEYGGRAFGFPGVTRRDAFTAFLAARASVLQHIRRYSPIEHASRDDPPVFMVFPAQEQAPVPGEMQRDPTHSAVSGLMLQRKLRALGVECELRYPGDGQTGHPGMQEFLTVKLKPEAE